MSEFALTVLTWMIVAALGMLLVYLAVRAAPLLLESILEIKEILEDLKGD